MPIFESLKTGLLAQTAEDTIDAGRALATELPHNAIVTLKGDLGAGKTTFVKGLASGFGIQSLITSPTFNILNCYSGSTTLLHVDAYRLTGAENALDDLMIEDFMNPPYCLAIEWPENLGPLPWAATLSLEFNLGSENSRVIRSL